MASLVHVRRVATIPKANVDRVARLIEYVGASDTTIAGSRNVLAPIVIWLAIQRWGEQGFRDRMRYSDQLADYAIAEFAKSGPRLRNRRIR